MTCLIVKLVIRIHSIQHILTYCSKPCYAKKTFVFYVVHSISFQTFFVQAFHIVRDSWKFSMLLPYIIIPYIIMKIQCVIVIHHDWPIFMISGSNQHLQQQLEYTLLNPDCRSWWISKMQSGREDTLEER